MIPLRARLSSTFKEVNRVSVVWKNEIIEVTGISLAAIAQVPCLHHS